MRFLSLKSNCIKLQLLQLCPFIKCDQTVVFCGMVRFPEEILNGKIFESKQSQKQVSVPAYI